MTPNKTIIVSVVIPMRNEERYIGRCLESVLSNNFPIEEMEIVVADGCSTDRSREIVAEFAQRYPQVRLLENPKLVVPAGLNLAIRQSKGRFIIRMDAHSEYPPDYISACVRELTKGTADVVGGRLITRPGADTLAGKAIALLSQHPFGVGNSGFRLGWKGCYVDTVPFGAFQRSVFDRIGLFRESLVRHQDFELNSRIRKAGGKIFLSPDICLTYYNLPTFRKLMSRAFRDGLWVGRAWMLYPITFCWRHCAPLALLFALMLPLLANTVVPGAAFLSLGTLFLYISLALLSSLQIAAQNGLAMLGILPLLFLSFHIIYGIGILAGVLTSFSVATNDKQVLSEPQSALEAS
jgi:glycosyltransferase involved in cell wall biosynthesis